MASAILHYGVCNLLMPKYWFSNERHRSSENEAEPKGAKLCHASSIPQPLKLPEAIRQETCRLFHRQSPYCSQQQPQELSSLGRTNITSHSGKSIRISAC